MTLDEIAAEQQLIVNKKKQGILGMDLAGAPPSSTLQMGNQSGRSNPLTAPWLQMPDGGYPFSSNGTIALPAVGSGFTDVIGPNAPAGGFPMQVPNGYDGVITKLVCFYNGQGFTSGSGSLIWRILINGQAVRNYDNILVQLGVTPFPGDIAGIRVSSGDTVEFQVSNVGVVSASTQIFCFLGGWYYSNKLTN